MKVSGEIAGWIKKQVEKSHKKGVVFGLSGGLDSAVVACLSKKALGNKVLGLVLPCGSISKDMEFARMIAAKFDIRTKEIVLEDIFNECVKTFPEANNLAKANLKPRLRMSILYYFANTLDFLVVGTGNKSEITIGYFTKYGDGGVDILPLGDLFKTEVRELAKELGIPEEIIKRPPSAGLWEGQTDEAEIGLTYEELDNAVKALENKSTEGINVDILSKAKKMIENSKHKRIEIPIWRRVK